MPGIDDRFDWTDEQRAQLVPGSTVETFLGRKTVVISPYEGTRLPWLYAYRHESLQHEDLSRADPSTIDPPVAHAPAASEAALADRCRELETALSKIDAIRNDIVGRQLINWSTHIYPLVAALGEAGYKGLGYEKARKEACTLVDRIIAAEAKLTAAAALIDKWRATAVEIHADSKREPTERDAYMSCADDLAIALGLGDQDGGEDVDR